MSSTAPSALRLNAVLAGLRAAGEDTRLRLLALLSEGDLTVSDLTDILGQSQPRISRHLKLMVDAGLVSRHREGAWAFFRLAQTGEGAVLGQWLAGQLDRADPVMASDGQRLLAVRAARGEAAQAISPAMPPNGTVSARSMPPTTGSRMRSATRWGRGVSNPCSIWAPARARC